MKSLTKVLLGAGAGVGIGVLIAALTGKKHNNEEELYTVDETECDSCSDTEEAE